MQYRGWWPRTLSLGFACVASANCSPSAATTFTDQTCGSLTIESSSATVITAASDLPTTSDDGASVLTVHLLLTVQGASTPSYTLSLNATGLQANQVIDFSTTGVAAGTYFATATLSGCNDQGGNDPGTVNIVGSNSVSIP
jgi:hypothetical protein